MCHVSGVRFHMSNVTCHVSCFKCQVSPVTCHMSLMPTSTATDPPIANSQYAQQDYVADLDLDPQINFFWCGDF